jgi:hypothetical protein
VPVSRGRHGVVGAPRRAVYALVDSTASVRRRIGASLSRLGYVALVPGVFWTTASRVTTRDGRQAIRVVLRRAAREDPFVAVVFRGEAPLGRQAAWICSVGKEQRR